MHAFVLASGDLAGALAGWAIWCFAFAGAGWALGSQYDKIHHAFTGVEVLVVAAAVVATAWLLHRSRGRRAQVSR